MNTETERKAFESKFPVPENVRWNPDWCGAGRYEPDNALLNPEASESAFLQHQRWIGFKAARPAMPEEGDFARLYRFNDLGQVLVMLDLNPDDEEREAEIRFHFDPKVEALGICSAAMCFEGTDADEKAKRSFSRLTEADIQLFASETVRKTREIFSDFGAQDDD